MKNIAHKFDADRAAEIIVEILEKGAARRRNVVMECVSKAGLNKEQMRDSTPGAELNRAKCVTGTAISRLIRMGYVAEDDNSFIRLVKESDSVQEEVKRDAVIRASLLEILAGGATDKKKLLKNSAAKGVSTDKNATYKAAHADAGRILSDLVKLGEVVKEGDKFRLSTAADIPAKRKRAPKGSPRGDNEFRAESAEEKTARLIRERNSALFSRLSDEEFEDRSVELMVKYCKYSRPLAKVEGKVTGGPDDGGIDGTIEITDELFGKQKIIMQMKHFNVAGKFVPLCEVQEFAGVLSADSEAMIGVFCSSTKFSKGVAAFVKKLRYKPIILVEAKDWLSLAEKCGYELTGNY